MTLPEFNSFTWAHLAPVLLGLLVGYWSIGKAKKWSHDLQVLVGTLIALFLPVLMIFDIVSAMIFGTFNAALDLPLHMCRLVTFLIPIMIYRQDRWLFGILYFWVLAGTTQAILTPDIQLGFPSYEYIRYWVLHLTLVWLIIYVVVVFEFRPTWKDFWQAVWWAQIYLIFTFPINWMLNGNYGYTMRKPPVSSIADYMGNWPWYILTGELIMVILFLLLYLPFGIKRWRKQSS